MLRVGVVGCGLIGSRRAASAVAAGDQVVVVADLSRERAETVARAHGARVAEDWQTLVESPEIDVVVAAGFNSAAMPVTLAALEAGKHVLCEKPFGRNAVESAALLAASESAEGIVKVGFTLRHHEAIAKAHELAQAGAIGEPVALRCAYGHGGRPGYDLEWRGNPEFAGGGELLDQGVHVVDLSRWFLGEFETVTGVVATWFWNLGPLEDNGFALLRTPEGRTAALHTSWTQWRNLFRLELLGTDGLLTVEGLGGSYGPERLVHARRNLQGGPPLETTLEVIRPEAAWEREWHEFRSAALDGREPLGSARDGHQAARLLDAIYRSADTGAPQRLAYEVAA